MIGRLVRSSFARFAVVGLLGFTTDMLLLWLLHGVFRVWLPVATTVAYIVAFALSFVLSREWVFPDSGDMRVQIMRYLALVIGILVLTVVGVQALAWLSVWYLVAKVLTSGVVAIVNYVASRWWVFRTG